MIQRISPPWFFAHTHNATHTSAAASNTAVRDRSTCTCTDWWSHQSECPSAHNEMTTRVITNATRTTAPRTMREFSAPSHLVVQHWTTPPCRRSGGPTPASIHVLRETTRCLFSDGPRPTNHYSGNGSTMGLCTIAPTLRSSKAGSMLAYTT
jgi:hypothetical protein